MKIRLSLTLDVHRNRPAEHPERESQADSLVERADRHPIGFSAEPGRVEREWWEDTR